MAFITPAPCTPGGGGGGPEFDTEPLVLCDILPNGTVAGTALAVYVYDETTGAPVGPPTFVNPTTGAPYVAQGTLQPCDEPCVKCDTAVLCDNTTTPASEVVLSSMVMLDTPNVVGNDGWNVTAFNTANATNTPQVCSGVSGPPLPVPYPAFYNADWCSAWLAGCPAGTPAGGGCALNPGPALGLTSDFQSVNCGTGSGFADSCSRYLVEKTFNTDAACTKIRVTSQRFRADGSAKVMIDGQDTGIFGAYNASSPDGTITLTVAPGPHTMTIDLRDSESPTWIQGGLTIECLGITPAGIASVQFLRTTCRTCIGDVLSVTDTTLDGQTPYVPTATVTICDPGASNIPTPCASCESYVLADRVVDLSGQLQCVTFLRRICHNCDGTVSSVTDTLLDGTSPYSPTGNIGLGCDYPEDEEILCDAGTNSIAFVRTYLKDPNGVIVKVHDADLNGNPYTVIGPVIVCPSSTRDSEIVTLCDDNGPFLRQYVYDGEDASFIGRSDTKLDGVTAYVTVGVVKSCLADCAPVELGTVCIAGPGPLTTPLMTVRNCDGSIHYYNPSTGNEVITPTIVACEVFEYFEEILCDAGNANHQFLRRYIGSATAGINSVQYNLELDGATAYVPVGPIVICPVTTTVVTERDVEIVTLCDDNGGFLRRFVYDETTGLPTTIVTTDFAGNPYVPVGTVKVCDQTVAVTELDADTQFLCDNAATTFIRRYVFNETTGAIGAVADFTLAGAPYSPAGPVTAGACITSSPVDDVELIEHCDTLGNVHTTFYKRLVFDKNGVLLSTTLIDASGNPYVITGTVTVGQCSACCAFNAGTGCTNTGSGTYVSVRNPDGTFSLIDPVTGAAVAAVNVIACPSQTVTVAPTTLDTTVARQTGAGSIVIAAGARSITIVSLLGAPTVAISGSTTTAIPAGVTLTWAVDASSQTLLKAHTFTGLAGDDFIITTTR